jgi:hypothetical protein
MALFALVTRRTVDVPLNLAVVLIRNGIDDETQTDENNNVDQ